MALCGCPEPRAPRGAWRRGRRRLSPAPRLRRVCRRIDDRPARGACIDRIRGERSTDRDDRRRRRACCSSLRGCYVQWNEGLGEYASAAMRFVQSEGRRTAAGRPQAFYYLWRSFRCAARARTARLRAGTTRFGADVGATRVDVGARPDDECRVPPRRAAGAFARRHRSDRRPGGRADRTHVSRRARCVSALSSPWRPRWCSRRYRSGTAGYRMPTPGAIVRQAGRISDRLVRASPDIQPSPRYRGAGGLSLALHAAAAARARRRIRPADSLSRRPSVCRRTAVVDSGLLRNSRRHDACAPAARSGRRIGGGAARRNRCRSSARGPISLHGFANTVRGARPSARRDIVEVWLPKPGRERGPIRGHRIAVPLTVPSESCPRRVQRRSLHSSPRARLAAAPRCSSSRAGSCTGLTSASTRRSCRHLRPASRQLVRRSSRRCRHAGSLGFALDQRRAGRPPVLARPRAEPIGNGLMMLPGILLSQISVVSIALVYAIARRAGRDRVEALIAAGADGIGDDDVLLRAALLPYDSSLALAIAGAVVRPRHAASWIRFRAGPRQAPRSSPTTAIGCSSPSSSWSTSFHEGRTPMRSRGDAGRLRGCRFSDRARWRSWRWSLRPARHCCFQGCAGWRPR